MRRSRSAPSSTRSGRRATSSCGRKRIAGHDDFCCELVLREILRIQRDDEISTAVLGAFPERRVARIRVGLNRASRLDRYRFFPQPIDDRTDQCRANVESGQDGRVLVKNISRDQPCECVVFKPIANQLRALGLRSDMSFEARHPGHQDGRVDHAFRPWLLRLRRQRSVPAWSVLCDRF